MMRRGNKPVASDLKLAMRATFLAPNGTMSDAQRIVLAALCQHCGGGQELSVMSPDGKIDPNAVLIAVGKQSVWLWINQLLGIPDTEVAALAAWRGPQPPFQGQ